MKEQKGTFQRVEPIEKLYRLPQKREQLCFKNGAKRGQGEALRCVIAKIKIPWEKPEGEKSLRIYISRRKKEEERREKI
jgi:hypothetical protein